jgi:hypothetical protein
MSKKKYHIKNKYLLIFLWSIVGLLIVYLIFDIINTPTQQKQPEQVLLPTVSPTKVVIPTLDPRTNDWQQYAVECKQPTISRNDKVVKYPSPSKKHYLLHVPASNKKGSYIVMYDEFDRFIFCFYPQKTEDFLLSGVAKYFHDYWIDDNTIAFKWNDSGYTGDQKPFQYSLETKKITLIYEDIYDFDTTGGSLITQPKRTYIEKDIYYRRADKTQVYVGHINGKVNGLSPSGKYIVYLINIPSITPYGSVYGSESVYIAKIEPNGIKNAKLLGTVYLYLGGFGGIYDNQYATWSPDEREVTIQDFLTERKKFTNPF